MYCLVTISQCTCWTFAFIFSSGLAPLHGRGAVLGEGVGTVEAIGGETVAAAAPLSPPVAQTIVLLRLTEGRSPLPLLSLTS